MEIATATDACSPRALPWVGPLSLPGPQSPEAYARLVAWDQSLLATFARTENWGMETSLDLFECDLDVMHDPARLPQLEGELRAFLHLRAPADPLLARFGEKGGRQEYALLQLPRACQISVHLLEENRGICLTLFSSSAYPPYQVAALCQRWFGARELCLAIQFRGGRPPASRLDG